MVIKASTVTFESISIGDELPTIQRSETQEDIDNYHVLNPIPEPQISSKSLHTDKEFAEKGIFGGTVNFGVVTCAFMTQLLQEAFPTKNVAQSKLNMRALEPIRTNDVVSYTGKVLDKREENGKRLVDVEVTGTNQRGQSVAVAKATIPL